MPLFGYNNSILNSVIVITYNKTITCVYYITILGLGDKSHFTHSFYVLGE